jgi:hypothetical protein
MLYLALPLFLWTTAAYAQTDASAAPETVPVADSTPAPSPADVSAPAPMDATEAATDVSAAATEPTKPAPPPKPDKSLGEAVGGFIQAIKGGDWTLIIAFGLMLLIWVIRFVWKAFPAKWTPWIAAGVAVVGAIAVALINGEDLLHALHAGLLVSVSSGGLFSLINSLKKKSTKDGQPSED